MSQPASLCFLRPSRILDLVEQVTLAALIDLRTVICLLSFASASVSPSAFAFASDSQEEEHLPHLELPAIQLATCDSH